MRFYGQTYREVLSLPLRTFWSLSANVVRIRAEEQIAVMDLYLLGGMGASEEVITTMQERYKEQMGETAVVSHNPVANNDDEITKTGLAQLRKLKGKMVN